MLTSIIAGSCKQSRRCQCNKAKLLSSLWINECQIIKSRRRFTTSKNKDIISNAKRILPQQVWHRTMTTDTEAITKINKKVEYIDVLTAALDQSNVAIAQSLVDNTFTLLRKGSPELAWDCYRDLTCRGIQKYLSREQYRQLIKQFNHTKSKHNLEYIITLIEDMKQLGYQVGRKEKLLLMRSLGLNGNINAMEQIFEDLKTDQLLFVPSHIEGAVQRPFNILLTTYGEQIHQLDSWSIAEKSMNVYGEMLDGNIQPLPSTTRLLMENIKLADRSDEMVEKVWEWFWTKIGSNVTEKTIELEPSLFREMVIYFSNVGRPKYALEINDIMAKRNIPRTVPMMTALIHKVGRAGDIDKSMNLFDEMRTIEGFVPTLVTYNALIDIYAHKKPEPDIAGANRMYNMLSEVGLSPDVITFGTLIDMFSKRSDLIGAQKLYKDMKERQIKPTPHIYSSFIECFINLNDYKSALDVLNLLKKQAKRSLPPARESYNLMFKGLVEGGLIKESIGLLNTMIKEDMGLEAKTFNPLMSYYARRGEPNGVHKVASMMTKAKVKPTIYSYTNLLYAYAKAGDIEGAENIFNTFKQKYRPSVHSYNALLYVYTKNNLMDKVLETYKRMSKSLIELNEYTYGILMYFYSRRKEIKSVESLMNTMESNNIKPGHICWTILMQTYFESGQTELGKNVMDKMIQIGWEPSNVSWGIMINGFIQANQLEIAENLLNDVIDRRTNDDNIYKQNSYLLKDVNSHVDYEKSIPKTIEDVIRKSNLTNFKPKLSPHLFTPIIDAYREKGDYNQAKLIYKQMCQLSVPITVPVYVSLMNIFDNESNHKAVESMWNAIYKNDNSNLINLDPIFNEQPLQVPEIQYNYTNLLTLSEHDEMEITKPLIQNQVSPFALSIYINSLLSQKRINDIESLWTQLSEENYTFDEHNWNRYIVVLIESGQLEKACQIISKEFFGKSKLDTDNTNYVKKTHRKRDDIFISNDDQLHTKTCTILAKAFNIPGAENMGEYRLRSTVTDLIKDYISQLDRQNRIDANHII